MFRPRASKLSTVVGSNPCFKLKFTSLTAKENFMRKLAKQVNGMCEVPNCIEPAWEL